MAERELLAAWRRQRRSLLLYADLDYLTRDNDSFGHDGGDRMLVDAAQVLKGVFRSGDVAARLGGDELAITTAANSCCSA
ncbi:diguanylate cyclase [Pseudomonas paeninsulae]|uniref:diguanylate cyclase n=1 Tax=Pseudomonas paeninsulae TaxID=3110772 RepID=UPI002D775E1F|nr:diguanylate cyclase [Pseudomonas sp. IT1137]